MAKQAFNDNYEFYTIRGDQNKELSLKEYINMITPYLYEIINKKKSTNQKTQLDVGINFSHLTDKKKNHTLYIKSENIEIFPGDDTNEIIKELTDSLFHNYQEQLLIPRNGSNCIFDSAEVLGVHFQQIDLKRGGSYIKSPEWLKNKGATINPQNTKDNYCFMYAITIALNYHEINHHPERISKVIPFTSKYNWDGINFPAERKEWKTFERNNPSIALNILSVPYDKKDIVTQYKSKYNYKLKNQVTLVMITDNKEKWHYLALKSIPTDNGYMRPTKSISKLLRGISSKQNGDILIDQKNH